MASCPNDVRAAAACKDWKTPLNALPCPPGMGPFPSLFYGSVRLMMQ
jgi:hypothetical protein